MYNQKSQDVSKKQDMIEKFSEKKGRTVNINEILADYYEKIEKKPRKAYGLRNCASYLMFKRYEDEKNTQKLVGAKFCRHPLCVMCQWRNRIEILKCLYKALEAILKEGGMSLYFLTLTTRNFAKLEQSTLKFLERKSVEFIRNVFRTKSYYISLEITIAKNGTYHPHIHAIIASDKELDVTPKSISLYRRLWCLTYGEQDYKYLLLTLYPLASNSVSEVTKYILKPSVCPEPEKIIEIATAVHNVKKSFASGCIRKYLKIAKEKIAEEENEESVRLDTYDYILEIYKWLGNKYFLSEREVKNLRSEVKGHEMTREALDEMEQIG